MIADALFLRPLRKLKTVLTFPRFGYSLKLFADTLYILVVKQQSHLNLAVVLRLARRTLPLLGWIFAGTVNLKVLKYFIHYFQDREVNGHPCKFIQEAATRPYREIHWCRTTGKCKLKWNCLFYTICKGCRQALKQKNVRTVLNLSKHAVADISKTSKDKLDNFKVSAIVYKVKCKECSFKYVDESNRSWDAIEKTYNPGRWTNNESTKTTMNQQSYNTCMHACWDDRTS